MSEGKAKGFREDEHATLWFEDRIYVPNDPEIRKLIFQEAHDSPYSIHPGNTKMYLDLKDIWTAVKNILKYLKRTKDMFIVYRGDKELVVNGYINASFDTDRMTLSHKPDMYFC